MGLYRHKSDWLYKFIINCMIVAIFIIHTQANAQSKIPAGLKISDTFAPGMGNPIGTIQETDGNAIVIHYGDSTGYKTAKDLPIFPEDTLITGNASLRIVLSDKSILTVASQTEVIINNSRLDIPKKNRTTNIELKMGKVRCVVMKFLKFKRSEFNVTTKTAWIGVRGSDFIVSATETSTIVTGLDDTILEVMSLSFPQAVPVRVKSFEQTRIDAGAKPSHVIKLSPEQIENLKKEINQTAQPELTDSKTQLTNRGVDSFTSTSGLQLGTPTAEKSIELVPPENFIEQRSIQPLDILEKELMNTQLQEISLLQETAAQDVTKETITTQIKDTPWFPVPLEK